MAERWRRLVAALDAWIGRRLATRIARRTVTGFARHEGPLIAGSMAYNSLLALFQVVVLGVVGFSLLIGEGDARRILVERLEGALPLQPGIIGAVIDSLVEARGGITVISVVILVWGGMGLFSALSLGIGRAFAGAAPRPFWLDKLVALLMLGTVALLALAAVVIGFVAGLAAKAAAALPGGERGGQLLLDLVGLLLPIVLVFAALLVLYRVVPTHRVAWRHLLLGATVATVLWTALRVGFTFYATELARYETAFGPISTAITLLVFLYFAGAVVLLGAEVARASALEEEQADAVAPDTNR
jgi:membrane protein